eukprot:Nk52_evm50s152 gene=Nk52_evmTU50s152
MVLCHCCGSGDLLSEEYCGRAFRVRYCSGNPYCPSYCMEGRRVALRFPITEKDHEALCEIHNEADTMEYLHFLVGMSKEQFRERLDVILKACSDAREMCFHIFAFGDDSSFDASPSDWNGEIWGSVGVKYMTVEDGMVEGWLGIVLSSRVWGKEYGLEALFLTMFYAFEIAKVHKLRMGTNENNMRMRGFFEKYGMEFNGTSLLDEAIHKDQNLSYNYSLNKDRWPLVNQKLQSRLYDNAIKS